MAVPVWATNQVLLASDVNNWFVPIAAFKTNPTARTSTTISADPDLSISVVSNSVYEISALINFQNVGGTSAISWNFAIPSGTNTSGYGAAYPIPGPTFAEWGNTWTATQSAAASDNLSHGMIIRGTLITSSTSGLLTFQWACNAASGTISVFAGSHLVARRIS
jgi:hypothetical protein